MPNAKNTQENSFYVMFIDLLKDIYDAENQILEALPKVIQTVCNSELKEALSQHLDETKGQIDRLKKIFKALNENPIGERCEGMQGLIQECRETLQKNLAPAAKDASLIIACQKVEHYEIASYGSVRTLARHLNNAEINKHIDFDEIADMLQATLDEEGDADEKLTEIAEGGFFTQGVNAEAEKSC